VKWEAAALSVRAQRLPVALLFCHTSYENPQYTVFIRKYTLFLKKYIITVAIVCELKMKKEMTVMM
jgi:hypothetical protein